MGQGIADDIEEESSQDEEGFENATVEGYVAPVVHNRLVKKPPICKK
jgi:hypothetical protein